MAMRFPARLFIGFFFAPVIACAEDVSIVYPVTGKPFPARISRIDSKWNITFIAGSVRQNLAAADMVSWGAQIDCERGPQVVLADGGLLIAESLEINDEHLVFETRHFGPARVPLKFLRGIVFQPPVDRLDRDRMLQRVQSSPGQEDQLLLANGDVLRGSLITPDKDATTTYPDGEPLTLETGTRRISIPRDRISAVVFNPALVEQPRPQGMIARIGMRDGTCLSVARLETSDDKIELLLPGGLKVQTAPGIPPEDFFADLSFLQFTSDRVTFLSDLQPLGGKHVPFLTTKWEHQLDRSVLGGRLRWRDQIYAKGISMHSTSRLAYDLDGSYQSFAAELALDQQAGNRGSVKYRVYLQNGEGAWSRAYASPVIRGGDKPVHINISLRNVRRIALIVDRADRGDEMDHANWLNARLTK